MIGTIPQLQSFSLHAGNRFSLATESKPLINTISGSVMHVKCSPAGFQTMSKKVSQWYAAQLNPTLTSLASVNQRIDVRR